MNKAGQHAHREGSNGQRAAAQEQSPQQPVQEPEAAGPMTAGYEDLVAAGYEILSREPLTISIPPGLMAQGPRPALTPEQEAAREKKYHQAVEKVLEEEKAGICHPVHPGWQYLFTRSRELADELRRQDAEAAGGQETEE